MRTIHFTSAARRKIAQYQKDDPEGIDQVLDALNLLPGNPRPAGAARWGADQMRIHVGLYRVMYRIQDGPPVIISIEHVGRLGS